MQNPAAKIDSRKIFIAAWILGLIFYFIDYVTRSAPSLMVGSLAEQFGLSTARTISLFGSYYYSYSVCALVAGICLDKFGARYSMFAGCFILGIGCILFVASSHFAGTFGRLLQGAGSAFAFPGCVFLATKGFSARTQATAIGITQCVGMLGGAAGQFVVQPMLASGLSPKIFWLIAGILCVVPAILMLIITPKPTEAESEKSRNTSFVEPFKIIFSNRQSWLTGIISGLMFAPTTVFIMTWGIGYLKYDLGYSTGNAATTAAMVSFGWVLGAPLLGFISDKIARRKPVVIGACMGMVLMLVLWILMPKLLPVKLLLLIFGLFSGAAMVPYSIIKEVNPDYVKGSATGVQNFVTFGVTSLLAPVFANLFGNSLALGGDVSAHFTQSIGFWIVAIMLAIVLSFFLKETGHKAA